MVDVQRVKLRIRDLLDAVDDAEALLQAFLILTTADAVNSIKAGRNESTLVN